MKYELQIIAFIRRVSNHKSRCDLTINIWKPALRKAGLEERRLYETRHTFATLMLDGGELPGWVQKMMGHETLQMIHKNYQREDGRAFMEYVYNAPSAQGCDEINERIDRDATQKK